MRNILIALRFILAVTVTSIALVFAAMSASIVVEVVERQLHSGYTLSGKDVYVPLWLLATFFFVKWSRDAWSAWNRLRRTPESR